MNDEEQRIVDSVIKFKNTHMDMNDEELEEELIDQLFPDKRDEMLAELEAQEEESMDWERNHLRDDLNGKLGDRIEKFLLSRGCWLNEADMEELEDETEEDDMIDERKTSLEEVKSIVNSKKIDSDPKTEKSHSYSR